MTSVRRDPGGLFAVRVSIPLDCDRLSVKSMQQFPRPGSQLKHEQ
jgi:hypothetical protein